MVITAHDLIDKFELGRIALCGQQGKIGEWRIDQMRSILWPLFAPVQIL